MDAQAYAMRIWGGQSSSLSRNERISRIERALSDQGLPSAGVQYPAHEPPPDPAESDPKGWRDALHINNTGIV